MKKYILALFILAIAAVPFYGFAIETTSSVTESMPPYKDCWYGNPIILRQGMKSEEVKYLQTTLSQNSAIYPEGVVTGYFGPLTNKAVIKLQEKYGFPQTGVIDDSVRNMVFPCMTVRVTNPNGGETFKVRDTMTISYEIQMPAYEILQPGQPQPMIQQISQEKIEKMTLTYPNQIVRPMPQVLSVDLVETGLALTKCVQVQCTQAPCPPQKCISEGSRVIFHIRNISLSEKGNSGSFTWTIPGSIPESSNYKIRISSGKPYIELNPGGSSILPSWYVFDESDAGFSILGGQLPTPSITPLPLDQDIAQLRAEISSMMKKLQEMMDRLNKLINR